MMGGDGPKGELHEIKAPREVITKRITFDGRHDVTVQYPASGLNPMDIINALHLLSAQVQRELAAMDKK